MAALPTLAPSGNPGTIALRYQGTQVSRYPSTQVLRYSGTQVLQVSRFPFTPQFKSWQADSMETPSIYGVLGVQKVINIHKKNVKEKNYESENDIGKS